MNSRRRHPHHEWEIIDDEDDRPFRYVLTRAVLAWGVQWRGETHWPDGPLTGAAGPLATRRTRSADPTQPPPYAPPLEFRP